MKLYIFHNKKACQFNCLIYVQDIKVFIYQKLNNTVNVLEISSLVWKWWHKFTWKLLRNCATFSTCSNLFLFLLLPFSQLLAKKMASSNFVNKHLRTTHKCSDAMDSFSFLVLFFLTFSCWVFSSQLLSLRIFASFRFFFFQSVFHSWMWLCLEKDNLVFINSEYKLLQ